MNFYIRESNVNYVLLARSTQQNGIKQSINVDAKRVNKKKKYTQNISHRWKGMSRVREGSERWHQSSSNKSGCRLDISKQIFLDKSILFDGFADSLNCLKLLHFYQWKFKMKVSLPCGCIPQ